jgi:hypothetical protein
MKQTSKAILLLLLVACSAPQPQPEYYPVATRRNAPEPVYSRLTWSHLPQPVKPKVGQDSPYLLPVVDFEMPNTTLGEAIEALAQSMGYRWDYPKSLARRNVRIRMSGNVEEVLAEISKQAKVSGAFDHNQRIVKVLDEQVVPRLPRNS